VIAAYLGVEDAEVDAVESDILAGDPR